MCKIKSVKQALNVKIMRQYITIKNFKVSKPRFPLLPRIETSFCVQTASDMSHRVESSLTHDDSNEYLLYLVKAYREKFKDNHRHRASNHKIPNRTKLHLG